MVALVIEDDIYPDDKKQKYQDVLNRNYEQIEPLKNGEYSKTLVTEAAELASGFAFFEPVIINSNNGNSLDSLVLVLSKMFGKGNFRLNQSIPERILFAEKENPFCFAVYIRYKLTVRKTFKLK